MIAGGGSTGILELSLAQGKEEGTVLVAAQAPMV